MVKPSALSLTIALAITLAIALAACGEPTEPARCGPGTYDAGGICIAYGGGDPRRDDEGGGDPGDPRPAGDNPQAGDLTAGDFDFGDFAFGDFAGGDFDFGDLVLSNGFALVSWTVENGGSSASCPTAGLVTIDAVGPTTVNQSAACESALLVMELPPAAYTFQIVLTDAANFPGQEARPQTAPTATLAAGGFEMIEVVIECGFCS